MSKNDDFWYEVCSVISKQEDLIEREMWATIKLSTTAMDTKEDQLRTVAIAGNLAEALKRLREARSLLRGGGR